MSMLAALSGDTEAQRLRSLHMAELPTVFVRLIRQVRQGDMKDFMLGALR